MSAVLSRHATADSAADPTSDVGNDEDSCFTMKTINSRDLDNITNNIRARLEAEGASISSDEGLEVEVF